MNKFIRKINRKLNKNDFDILSLSKAGQKKILDKYYKKDMDYIQRSFAQYKCQMSNKNTFLVLLFNLISIFLALPLSLFGLLNKISEKEKEEENLALNFLIDRQLIPESLRLSYNIKNGRSNIKLRKEDLVFMGREVITKYPLSFYFHIKILYKISIYRYNIDSYEPKAFLVSSEYSFTSSILTKYLKQKNIKHINIMHGDKLFFIRDSYFAFDGFYLWDEHYIRLFKELRAEENQFLIEVPKIFKDYMEYKDINKNNNNHRLTYYLQIHTREKLAKIEKNLSKMKDRFNIKLRPHPIYSDMDTIRDIFKGFEIENTKKTRIEESIKDTDYVCSLYSTVLYQAYFFDKNIIIDDCLDERYYEKLRELDYIMISKEHTRLSKLVRS